MFASPPPESLVVEIVLASGEFCAGETSIDVLEGEVTVSTIG